MKHFPNAIPEVEQAILHGKHLFNAYAVSSKLRLRMFIAQMAHESGGFKHLRELSYRNTTFEDKYGRHTNVGKILGNIHEGDGERFKGRGIIQLTGRWNYGHYGKIINEDILAEPELAEQPYIALKLALAYWDKKKVNIAADDMNVRYATKLINGGSNGLKDRQRIYDLLGSNMELTDYVR